jgi:DNA-binding MarR family transcriptional regulator
VTARRAELQEALLAAMRAAEAAADTVDDAFADYIGVNRTDARCLAILHGEGPMTAGELARRVSLTTGAVTVALDRLEAVGYARRLPDPVDRRRVTVETTPRYRRLARDVYDDAETIERICDGRSTAELEQLIAFVQRLADAGARRLDHLRRKSARRRTS